MISLKIVDNSKGVVAQLKLGREKIADTLPLMKSISVVASFSVSRNFEVGGRPGWKPLAPATIRFKMKHGKPLRPLVFSGALSQIVRTATKTFALIGVQPRTQAYAAIQHFGGKAGRGHKVTIPARPYMVLQPEDKADIIALAEKHLEAGLGGK